MGINMKTIEQYVQSSALLLVLTVEAVISGNNPYVCILIAGMLMILFTVRNLSDKQNILLFGIQIMFSIAFVIISGSVFSYVIFYECRYINNKFLQIISPSIVYLVLEIIKNTLSFPVMLFNVLFLMVLSTVIYIAENLILKYISAKNQIAQAVSVTAVNEMYEKKLNQELVMKNYFADKNARLEERENISRNIHNSVGHSITAAIMTLEAADMLFDSSPDKAREKMNTANDRIRTSLSSIRHAVRVLDNENEFISMSDLIREIKAIVDNFVMDTMIKIRIDFSGADGELVIPHEHTEFLTGAVQEFLTNGIRHGDADLFTIILISDSGHIKLSVWDNGNSDFNEDNKAVRISEGFGLKKITSYIKKCGGSVVYSNQNGFKAEITLPLYEEERGEKNK